MRWEPAVAALAALLLLASAQWLLRDGPAAIIPPSRGGPGGSVASNALRPPELGGFEQYDVNADNPFVPWHDRHKSAHAPPAGQILPPPRDQAVVTVPPSPPLQLPDAPMGGGDAPRALGFVRAGAQDAGLLVRLPGEPRARSLRPGETAGRWTLLAIEDGNTAVFADAAGRRYRQLIGR